MKIVRRLLSDAVVYSLTPLLSALVGFTLVPIYTRTFGPSDYGALALVNTTTALATIFVTFGLDSASYVFFWDHPEPDERRTTFSSWLAFTTASSLAIAAVAFVLRNVLARWLFAQEDLGHLWVLFGVNLVALNIPRIGIMWFRTNRAPWPAVLLGGLSSVGTAVFGVLFVVKAKFGLAGVIGGQAAGSWLGALVTFFVLRSVFAPRRVAKDRLVPMLRLGAPLVLMVNLNWLMGGAVTYLVNFLCSREDAGLYQVANSLASVLGLAMFAFDQAWAPLALSIRDESTARRVYGVTIEAVFVVGLLLAFAATAFARPALLLITHPEYVRAQWVLSVLALNTALVNLPSVISVTFAREKKMVPLVKATAGGAAVTMIFLPVAVKVLGLGKEGAALAVLAGTITIVALTFVSSQTVFRIEMHLARAGVATVIVCGWAAAFLLSRPLATSIPTMIGHGSLFLISLAAVLSVVYRAPLRAAWADARAAKSAPPV